MYHPTYAENAKASIRFKERRVAVVMTMLIHGTSFVGMTEIEKLQRTLKKLIDLFFADFARGEQFVQIEVSEPTIRHPGRQKFPQVAGFNRSQVAVFEEIRDLGSIESRHLRELLPARVTNRGFRDFDLNELLAPREVSEKEIDQLFESALQLLDLSHPDEGRSVD